MEAVEVSLALGSNLGDREPNLRHGLRLLTKALAISRVSSIYETEPWGFTEQPRFLNCVCLARTTWGPRALLALLKRIEATVGREPTFPGGPRVLDIDILFYGDTVLSETDLEIPHPRLAERAFVLVPLAEIAPQLYHPLLKVTVAKLAEGVSGKEGVKLWARPPSKVALSPRP